MLLLIAKISISQQLIAVNNNFAELEGKNVSNKDIRAAAKEAGVFLWQIAARYGISDGNFSRKLRQELPMDEKQKIFGIIEALAQERREVG